MLIPGTYLDATLIVTTAQPTVILVDVRDRPYDKREAGYGLTFPAAALRHVVLERLARTNGCTHLNDALRALAEVPVLADALTATLADPPSD